MNIPDAQYALIHVYVRTHLGMIVVPCERTRRPLLLMARQSRTEKLRIGSMIVQNNYV